MESFEDQDRAHIHKAAFKGAFGIHISQVASTESAAVLPKHQLSNFTLFPKLPIELRLRIWRASLPPPRIFTIVGGDNITLGKAAKDPLKVKKFGAIPQQLYLCKESRIEAKKYYKYLFAGTLSPKGIWIDYKKDALQFSSEQTLVKFLDSSQAALQSQSFDRPMDPRPEISAMLAELRFLVVGAERGDYAKTANNMLDFRNLEVVVLENMDLSSSPSHRKQRRAQLEQRWKRERINKTAKTGIANKVPKICWLGESKMRRLDKDGFPEGN